MGCRDRAQYAHPQINSQAKAKLILRNAYESLLARRPDGGYVPWLASAYGVSEDGRTYTFTLRDGVTFSDGDRLDAAAVALNVMRLKGPAYSGSISAGLVSHVADARAIDARTVVFSLDAVYAPFLAGVAALPLISPRSFASSQLKSGGKEIAGTGPSCSSVTRAARRSGSFATRPMTGRPPPPGTEGRPISTRSHTGSCLNRPSAPAR